MDGYREFYRNKHILVTGGAGAIGSNLVRALIALKPARVTVLDDLSSAMVWNLPKSPDLLFLEGSILDEHELKRVFSDRPAVVFHLAALFANQNSVDYPERDLMVNGLGTLRVLRFAQLSGTPRLVFASSGGSIYGSDAPLPLKEDHTSLHLNTPYQVTKMLGELYCNYFHKHYDTACTRVRFFNSYGPGEMPGQYRNVIPNFVFRALSGQALPITGSGDETRDFTFVADLVDGVLRAGAMEAAVGEAFNIGSGRQTSIRELAETINRLADNPAGISFHPKRKWDTGRRQASIEKACDRLGYAPETPLETGLTHTINWFREHWDQIRAEAKFGPGMSSAVPGVSFRG